MDARFATMDAASDVPTGCARAIVKTVVALSLPFVLSPREVASEAATNVAAAFTTCFSRLRQRRSQFNEEQKEALLTEDERFSEAAMMELRRRVMETPAMRWGPMTTDQPPRPSRWKQRKMQERVRAKSNPSPHWKRASPEKQEAFTTLASDTEKALDQILESTKTTRKHSKSSETLDAEAVKRLSGDDLVAQADAISPEKTGVESVLLDLQDDDGSYDGGPLREWLAGIDASRPEEYCVYAKQLEEHGFLTLEDLAQLESDDDVDQAMSEVGIAKFAHRLRIRKAIQRLHSHSSEENNATVATLPIAASA
ncbi:hypothetical protein F441_05347 [Phytophthora nicotianae CJ01A1]|uniref:SAM domain-containing protein n=6 Tax=Phytophthora nicotianae TaxID=4792 RepID=W2QFB2_PHYN3|nr:hypothetical protein PPTG_09520 [Phytophthora nicotianae INRA-310]ETI51276.1 hypothetical protein F443_05340 [Phytophthora nicotianae P1569]ETK91172.1 hypothetical protein L915_05201 [Phytophthora nicotianae]ETO80030.1 hypothetical protein F444_05386 [Phytophthora nicotianae P1976]ETP21041.1 hypothetical protein F441_05347 [Phytophthora nicotianae CJ01A1]ETP48990.1 hypothetical protein F442_05391 [Phytophthora nicotianae P10297]KUG01994.1 hypothetical protein AM587_10007637 [Phytophthora n